MLFPNFEKRKRNREFIFFERRKRNFPRHLAFKEGILILIRNGPLQTSNIPPKHYYIAVCHHTSDPEECTFLSKIYSISHRKRKGNSKQNLIDRENFLDAIASPSTYPGQSMGQSVSESLVVSDLEIAIASPSLFFVCV